MLLPSRTEEMLFFSIFTMGETGSYSRFTTRREGALRATREAMAEAALGLFLGGRTGPRLDGLLRGRPGPRFGGTALVFATRPVPVRS